MDLSQITKTLLATSNDFVAASTNDISGPEYNIKGVEFPQLGPSATLEVHSNARTETISYCTTLMFLRNKSTTLARSYKDMRWLHPANRTTSLQTAGFVVGQ